MGLDIPNVSENTALSFWSYSEMKLDYNHSAAEDRTSVFRAFTNNPQRDMHILHVPTQVLKIYILYLINDHISEEDS